MCGGCKHISQGYHCGIKHEDRNERRWVKIVSDHKDDRKWKDDLRKKTGRDGKRKDPETGGETFVQFLAARAVFLPWSVWKKWMNSTVSFKSTETKQLARQEIEHNLTPKQTLRPFSLLLFPSSSYGEQVLFQGLSRLCIFVQYCTVDSTVRLIVMSNFSICK